MNKQEKESLLRIVKIDQYRFDEIGLNWEELDLIKKEHINELSDLTVAAESISNALMKLDRVHSVRFRVKNVDHLLAKIIRKRHENPERIIDSKTYRTEITDLIGVRAIHLLKNQWVPIHKFVMEKWDIKETPIAYIRAGDSPGHLDTFNEAGFDVKEHKAGYRSLHYIISVIPYKKQYFAEIQLRTIFEEGWSEIDHRVRYPNNTDNALYTEFLSILNRLAGSADEMGSFIINLKYQLSEDKLQFREELKEKDRIIRELNEKIENLKIEPEQKADLVKSIKFFEGEPNIKLPSLADYEHKAIILPRTVTRHSLTKALEAAMRKEMSKKSNDGK